MLLKLSILLSLAVAVSPTSKFIERARTKSYDDSKVTTNIPNPNLKVSLAGLRESGAFFTAKDLSSSFSFTSQDFGFVRLNNRSVDLQLNSSIAYQEVDFGE